MKHIETLIGTNKSMKTKPLTFLLALTFLFLFSCSQAMMYAKDNSSDQNWGKDYADCYSLAEGYFGLQLWNSIVHNCLVGKGYNAVDKEGNTIHSLQRYSCQSTQVNENQTTHILTHTHFSVFV